MVNITLNGKTLNAFSLKGRTLWKVKRMSIFTHFLHHCTGYWAQGSKSRKGNNRHTEKEDRKLSVFADVMILYIENPKESTLKKIRANKFSICKIQEKCIKVSCIFIH